MNNENFGKFIAARRKEKAMTQKDLSEMLSVTDKAVSKWERGKGYPEITLLQKLADCLEVSISDLLNQGPDTCEAQTDEHPENESTLPDVSKEDNTKGSLSGVVFMILSGCFLIGAFVSLLCNYIINRTFDWSLYVLGSTVMSWLILFPWFVTCKHRLLISISIMYICILPFLTLVSYLCPVKNWVLPLALPIILVSLIPTYLTVILVAYTKISRYYVIAISFVLFGILANLSINKIVQDTLHDSTQNISNGITAVSFGFLAIVMIILGRLSKNHTHAHK